MEEIKKIYLTEKEAATRYGYSAQWYQRQRWLGTGPQFMKINGGKILYPIEQTDRWFANFGLKNSTSEV